MSSPSLCVSCSLQFSLFKRKNRCQGCKMLYCSQCFKKGEHLPRRNVKQCFKCHALSSHPFVRSELMLLSVKELKGFLEQKNVSATGCTEKSDLVDVIINHQAKPQVNASNASEASTSTQAPTPSTSNQASRNTQHASQGMNNFFGNLQIDPEIHRFVESIFQVDDNGIGGSRPPSRDELNLSERTRNENQPRYPNHSHQPHYPWTMAFPQSASSLPSQVPPQSNSVSLDSLKNANDIKKLSAKELKSVLDHNFVDYKGCVEKGELVERVLMLWESKRHQHNGSSASGSEKPGGENEVCKVCMDRIIDCVFLECGHLVTCVDCGRRLQECPLCRQNIVRIVRVFKS